MPFYHAMGKIPHKRHTQFRKPTAASTPRSSSARRASAAS